MIKYIYAILMFFMTKLAWADGLVPSVKGAYIRHPFLVILTFVLCFILPYLVLLPLFWKQQKRLLLISIILFVMNFPLYIDIFSLSSMILGFFFRIYDALFFSIFPENTATTFLSLVFILFTVAAVDSWIVLKVKKRTWKYLLFQLPILILFICLEIFWGLISPDLIDRLMD